MSVCVSHQPSGADLPGTVAALARQVLAVSQDARGPSALERQPGVDEGRGSAVMVHKERLQVHTRTFCDMKCIICTPKELKRVFIVLSCI